MAGTTNPTKTPTPVQLLDKSGNDIDATNPLPVASTPGAPSAATVVRTGVWTPGVTEAALSGTFPRGVTLLNTSTGGQTIFLGPSGVTTTGATKGFPLAPGASIDRPTWQDMTVVHALGDAAGSALSGVEM